MRIWKSILLFISVFGLLPVQAQTGKSSLLWEISGNGLKQPSYLYGTIHIQDKRVFEFNDSVLPKLIKADAFAMELTLDDENKAKLMSSIMLPEGKELRDFFSKKDYEKLSVFVKGLGYDINMFTKMKPFALISLILQAKMQKDMPESVDGYLYSSAGNLGKKRLSIETVEEQISAIESVTMKQLMEMVNDPDKSDKQFQEMVEAYAKNDLEKIMLLVNEESKEDKDFSKKLLEERNVRMADRISNMAKEQSTFAAVGAAHLPGTTGVIELLRKKGYSVKPIIAQHTPGNDKVLEAYSKPSGQVADSSSAKYALETEWFTINFPAEPKKTVQEAQVEGAASQQITTYMLQSADGQNLAYAVSYIDMEKPIADKQAADVFFENSTKKVSEKIPGAKLLSSTDLKLGNDFGKEMVFDFMGGQAIIKMRNYIHGNRVYTLQCISMASNDNNQAMKDYFASFRIK